MKFISKKRVASTVLAGVMALSMTAPAFASANTNITASYNPPTLSVVVPTAGKATINPYGLPYKLGEATVTGQKIGTTTPLVIQNKSSVALSVSASVTGTEVGTFKFDGTPITDSEQANKGNVVFQMFEADGVDAANVTDTEVINAKYAALKDEDALGETTITGATAATAANILTLKKGTADGELQDGGAAFFRLSGTVAKKPTVAWTKTDGFTAAIAFTFDPTADPAELAGSIGADITNIDQLNNTTATLTLTPALPTGVTVDDWTWTSSDITKISVAKDNTDAKKATATWVAAGNVTITVRGTGSDGVTYEATIDLTAA